MKLKPCPFCGSDDIEFLRVLDSDYVSMCCRSCTAQGNTRLSDSDAIEAWNTRAPEHTWQPIETAPKDGTGILGFSPRGSEIEVIYWEDGDWLGLGLGTDEEYRVLQPTHWQPLPPPPKEAE